MTNVTLTFLKCIIIKNAIEIALNTNNEPNTIDKI